MRRRAPKLLTLRGHTGDVWSVAFSPDSKRIASASVDNTVKVWDAQTGAAVLTLRGHTSQVSSVAFSPDGKRIVSAGILDKTVKLWDAQTGVEALTLRGHTESILRAWRSARTAIASPPQATITR